MEDTTKNADQLHECAVCLTKTSTHCGGCTEDVFFCSKEHQKLVRPTHKWFCGRDATVFTCAPLDDKESGALESVKDELYRDVLVEAPTSTLLQFLRSKGLFNGTWQDLMTQLKDEEQIVPEPKRSWALIHARNFLMKSSAGPRILNSAWRILSIDIMSLHSLIAGMLPPTIRFLRDFNAYLRQKLILTTLVQEFDGGGGTFLAGQRPGFRVDQIHLAQERLKPLVEQLPVDDGVKGMVSLGDSAGFSQLQKRLPPQSVTRRIGGA